MPSRLQFHGNLLACRQILRFVDFSKPTTTNLPNLEVTTRQLYANTLKNTATKNSHVQ